MKKIIALLMACMIVFGVSGCGSSGDVTDSTSKAAESSVAAETDQSSGDTKSPASSDDSSAEASSSATDSKAGNDAEASDSSAGTENASVEIQAVSTGEREINYIKFGTGTKNFVILPGLSIHSVLGSADAIAEAYSGFTEEYTVYLFDTANDIPEGYSIRDLAEDTAKAMENLFISKADIFGASMGGMTAQYLAIDHPDLVNKMVLGSTLAKPNDTSIKVMDEWISLAEAKYEDTLLASFADNIYSETTLEAYRDTLISSNKGISDEEYAKFIILAKACRSFDCYDELSSISCPVLVIGSKGDKVVTPQGSIEIAEALGCEIYLYDENYGHGVYDEAPDYKQRCMDFFAE